MSNLNPENTPCHIIQNLDAIAETASHEIGRGAWGTDYSDPEPEDYPDPKRWEEVLKQNQLLQETWDWIWSFVQAHSQQCEECGRVEVVQDDEWEEPDEDDLEDQDYMEWYQKSLGISTIKHYISVPPILYEQLNPDPSRYFDLIFQLLHHKGDDPARNIAYACIRQGYIYSQVLEHSRLWVNFQQVSNALKNAEVLEGQWLSVIGDRSIAGSKQVPVESVLMHPTTWHWFLKTYPLPGLLHLNTKRESLLAGHVGLLNSFSRSSRMTIHPRLPEDRVILQAGDTYESYPKSSPGDQL